MKIAVWHNLPSGGGKRALYSQVAGLVARGHQVEAWCPESADDRYLPLSEIITEHRLPIKLPAASSSLAYKLKRKLQLHDRLLEPEMDRHSQACAEAILQGGFDLAFVAPCRYFIVPRLGQFLSGRGLPVILYLQEPDRLRYEAMPELPWIARAASERLYSFPRRMARKVTDFVRNTRLRKDARRELEDAKRYDLILANSYFSRESIARAYGLDSRVCYLGYDAAQFHPLDPPPARERFVLGLGSLHLIKGVETAIEALACLPSPRPTLLWVANYEDAHYRRDMDALAACLQVDFQVRIRVADSELVDLLNRASIMLYTSRLEPFGYAPIEANACGAPVVAVAEGGVRETVVDGLNGFLCDRDPHALAEAMNRLLTNPGLAAEIGRRGVQMAHERWSPEDSIIRLEHHFQKVLDAEPKITPVHGK